jgi:hypothetical protein
MGDRLLLDLRFGQEGVRGLFRRKSHRDLVFIDGARALVLGVGQPDFQLQLGLLAAPALARPERRHQSAFARQILGQGVARRRLQQLQRAVEVGLADAVGADEHIEPRHGIGDGLQRPVADSPEFTDGEGHEPAFLAVADGQAWPLAYTSSRTK